MFLLTKFDSMAIQYDYAPVTELPRDAYAADYICLIKEESTYDVKPGDTLWHISEVLLGNGSKYAQLYDSNRNIITDANFILPGMQLSIPGGRLYIPKDRYDRGGLAYEGAMRIALPDMVDNSYFLESDIFDPTSFGNGISIFSTPVTNQMGENALTDHWEDFVSEVTRCSATCDGRVSNLTFEKYQVENGCDLCGYYFDFDTGEKTIEFVVFYRLGIQNMAEVIGVREKKNNETLIDVTRYIAASFEDYGGKIGMGYTKLGDNVGADDWNYPELHNLFTSAMKNFTNYTKRPDENFPNDHEIIWTEPKFEQAVRNSLIKLWQLNDEEKTEFLNRPIMASDIDVITDIKCTLYQEDADEKSPKRFVLSLSFNDQKEKIDLGENMIFTYTDLANFQNVKTLSIADSNLTDYSFINDMTQLRSLSLYAGKTVENMDFLTGLTNLRKLSLSSFSDYTNADWSVKTEDIAAFSNITGLDELRNCPHLGYLILEMPGLTDFSFLKNCPEICTVILYPEISDETKPATPDLELLPNARFLNFYGESIRWEP